MMQYPAAKVRMIVGYVKAKLESMRHETAFMVYVCDCLRLITENTAKYAGGSYMKAHYSDMISDKKPQPEKSAEEIIDDVVKKAGLEVI